MITKNFIFLTNKSTNRTDKTWYMFFPSNYVAYQGNKKYTTLSPTLDYVVGNSFHTKINSSSSKNYVSTLSPHSSFSFSQFRVSDLENHNPHYSFWLQEASNQSKFKSFLVISFYKLFLLTNYTNIELGIQFIKKKWFINNKKLNLCVGWENENNGVDWYTRKWKWRFGIWDSIRNKNQVH
jgi:hypothetical protein